MHENASPWTPAEVDRLDALCASLFISLVPNLNSFGHMHRWLEHDEYAPLAECPEGVEHPFLWAADREPYRYT